MGEDNGVESTKLSNLITAFKNADGHVKIRGGGVMAYFMGTYSQQLKILTLFWSTVSEQVRSLIPQFGVSDGLLHRAMEFFNKYY